MLINQASLIITVTPIPLFIEFHDSKKQEQYLFISTSCKIYFQIIFLIYLTFFRQFWLYAI